jgi:hypothetical protein
MDLRRPQTSNGAGLAGGEPADPCAIHPTSGSWLNLVEVWFCIIERQAIHRGTFASVRDLMIKIRAFITGWNDRCQPLHLDQDRRPDPDQSQPSNNFRFGPLAKRSSTR